MVIFYSCVKITNYFYGHFSVAMQQITNYFYGHFL